MPYSKIDRRLWNDERFRSWDRDVRLVWLYLLTCPHSNRLGCFVLSPHYVADDVQLELDAVREALATLEEADRIVWDRDRRVVCIRNHLHPDYNPLDNPSVVAAAVKDLADLPNSRRCLRALQEAIERWSRPHYEALEQRLKDRVQQGVTEGRRQGAGHGVGEGEAQGEGDGVPHPEPEPEPEREPEPIGRGAEDFSQSSKSSGEADVEKSREERWKRHRGEIAHAIRDHLYHRSQPPEIEVGGETWTLERDMSIARRLVLNGTDPATLVDAIRGLPLYRDREEEGAWLRGESLTLRVFNRAEEQGMSLLNRAAHAWRKWSQEDTTAHADGVAAVGDVTKQVVPAKEEMDA